MDPSLPQTLSDADDRTFANKLAARSGEGLMVATAFGFVHSATIGDYAVTATASVAFLLALSLRQSGKTDQAIERLPLFLAVFVALSVVPLATSQQGLVVLCGSTLFLCVAATLRDSNVVWRLTGWVMIVHILGMLARHQLMALEVQVLVPYLVFPTLIYGLIGMVLGRIIGRSNQRALVLGERLREVDIVIPATARIADGRLDEDVPGAGPIANALRQMQLDLRELVLQVQHSAHTLRSAAGAVDRNAATQRIGTTRLGEALDRAQQSHSEMLDLSSRMKTVSDQARRDSQDTLDVTKEMGDRLAALHKQTQRIGQLLTGIKAIANKSEILAVNAALEAAHAGEAGRGFALVASNLQGLAEATKAQLQAVEALNADIRAAADEAADSVALAAGATARSATVAKQISGHSAEQVDRASAFHAAMRDIDTIVDQVNQDAGAVHGHAAKVVSVANELNEKVDRFRT